MLGRSTPGRSPASQRIWKPLQMPSTRPPPRRELRDCAHDRREPRDRAAAKVVAVREASGQHDRADGRQLLVRVPDEPCLGAEQLERGDRVAVVVRARERDDRDHSATSISNDSMSGFASSCSHIRPISARADSASSASSSMSIDPADAHLVDGEVEMAERSEDGLALWIEDAFLRPDQDGGLHRRTTSGRRGSRRRGCL